MASRRVPNDNHAASSRPPAKTPEERENQLISGAMDLAARQIQDGTASSQVITHFLKLGSSREKLDQYKIQIETSLLATKQDVLEGQKRQEELIRDALNAMRSYSGAETPVQEEDVDEYYD